MIESVSGVKSYGSEDRSWKFQQKGTAGHRRSQNRKIHTIHVFHGVHEVALCLRDDPVVPCMALSMNELLDARVFHVWMLTHGSILVGKSLCKVIRRGARRIHAVIDDCGEAETRAARCLLLTRKFFSLAAASACLEPLHCEPSWES